MDEAEIIFRIDTIKAEIKFAKSCLQPHDTGHIHTAISWLEERVDTLEEELKQLQFKFSA
jgi:hypothetical protein|tara:strand:- start:166 stop:345 length:180 start_codon:yes stop_codon:yes gene_type:complete